MNITYFISTDSSFILLIYAEPISLLIPGFKLAFNYLKAKRFVDAIDICHHVSISFASPILVFKDLKQTEHTCTFMYFSEIHVLHVDYSLSTI